MIAFCLIFFLSTHTAYSQSGPPTISASNPSNGYVDPLEDRDSTTGALLGIKDVSITFSKPVTTTGGGALTVSNFQRKYFRNGVDVTDLQTQQVPTVTLLSGSGAGPYILRFAPRIPLGAWTKITAINVTDTSGTPIGSQGNNIVFGFLPMDTTQNGKVLGEDITRWLQINGNLYNPAPLTKAQFCDQKRNGTVAGEDIGRAMQLISGVGSYRAWNNFDIGPSSEAPTTCSNKIKDGNEQGVDCGGSCLFECPFNQTVGIELTLQGTPGEDYAVEWAYHDPRVDDAKVIYIKGNVKIGLQHNVHNQGGSGPMWYKIDRDEQHIELSSSGGGRKEQYSAPFALADKRYVETNAPVIGTIGSNGEDYYNNIGYAGERFKYRDRDASFGRRTNYGILDQQTGDESHVLSFWDAGANESEPDADWVLLIVNPKTPALRFRTRNTNAQYYSTPMKTYWIPKIVNPQVTYLTDNVDIELVNIMGGPISYRLNGGSTSTYAGVISSNSLANGVNTLEYWYNPSNRKTRTLIKNPDYPSKLEQHPHNFLWDSAKTLAIIRDRISKPGHYRDAFNDLLSKERSGDEEDIWNGFRLNDNTSGPSGYAYISAYIATIKGMNYEHENEDGEMENYARKAKKMLLDISFLSRTFGQEFGIDGHGPTGPFRPAFYYQGRGSGREAIAAALAYDLLVGSYTTAGGYSDGFTPIEDLRVRDALAHYAKTTLQFVNETSQQYMESGNVHYGASAEMATAVIALTMPKYNSAYYGTSGAPPDNIQAIHLWTPYPNHPNSWWSVATDEYPSNLYPNPDQSTYSRIAVWALAKNAQHAPNPNFFSGYWGGNVSPLYLVFSNILHNVGLNQVFPNSSDRTNWLSVEQKFNWYEQHSTCDDGNDFCMDFPVVNKHYPFALNALTTIKRFASPSDYSWWLQYGYGEGGPLGLSTFDDTLEYCFDGARNYYEEGIDCGGTCPQSCS